MPSLRDTLPRKRCWQGKGARDLSFISRLPNSSPKSGREASCSHFWFPGRTSVLGFTHPSEVPAAVTVVSQLIRGWFPPSLLIYLTHLVHLSLGKGVAAQLPRPCLLGRVRVGLGSTRRLREGVGVWEETRMDEVSLVILCCSHFAAVCVSEILTAGVTLHSGFLWCGGGGSGVYVLLFLTSSLSSRKRRISRFFFI